VFLEIATTFVLLVGCGLLTRSFVRLERVKPGFEPDQLLTSTLRLSRSRYGNPAKIVSTLDRILDEFSTVPGVRNVALSTTVPLSGRAPMYNVNSEGGSPRPEAEPADAELQVVSPSYFRTMDIPLHSGRVFEDNDVDSSMPVAVISDEMARRYWPDQEPIGKHLSVEAIRNNASLTVVGVVGNTRHAGLNLPPYPQLYVCYKQYPGLGASILVRSSTDAASLTAALRSEIKRIDEELPLSDARTMGDLLSDSISRPRFSTQVM